MGQALHSGLLAVRVIARPEVGAALVAPAVGGPHPGGALIAEHAAGSAALFRGEPDQAAVSWALDERSGHSADGAVGVALDGVASAVRDVGSEGHLHALVEAPGQAPGGAAFLRGGSHHLLTSRAPHQRRRDQSQLSTLKASRHVAAVVRTVLPDLHSDPLVLAGTPGGALVGRPRGDHHGTDRAAGDRRRDHGHVGVVPAGGLAPHVVALVVGEGGAGGHSTPGPVARAARLAAVGGGSFQKDLISLASRLWWALHLHLAGTRAGCAIASHHLGLPDAQTLPPVAAPGLANAALAQEPAVRLVALASVHKVLSAGGIGAAEGTLRFVDLGGVALEAIPTPVEDVPGGRLGGCGGSGRRRAARRVPLRPFLSVLKLDDLSIELSLQVVLAVGTQLDLSAMHHPRHALMTHLGRDLGFILSDRDAISVGVHVHARPLLGVRGHAPLRALALLGAHGLRSQRCAFARDFVLVVGSVDALIAPRASWALGVLARKQLREPGVGDGEGVRADLGLALLEQVLLEATAIAVVLEHAFNGLCGAPLIFAVMLAVLHARAAGAIGILLARPNDVKIGLVGPRATVLVIRARRASLSVQLQPCLVHFIPKRIGVGNLGVNCFRKVGTLSRLGTQRSGKLLALGPQLLILAILLGEVAPERLHKPLGIRKAVLRCVLLVVTAHKARVQLDVFTGSVPRGVGANGELLAAHSVVVLYQNVPVVEAFAVLALQVLHAACAASPLTLHNVERGLRVLHLPGGEPFVSGVALEDLTVNCHDEKLISGMALQNSGLDDVVDH
mmetsp:Transcript_49084/g.111112  ORF Transcript_49084/g.111112 Transcript_49084/m.111112 type:complete len:788 (+) Transcript_49084:130-2493(+)